MKRTEIKWGSKVTRKEIVYTPGNETVPKTKLGIITNWDGTKYLVVDETIEKGDKYYHFIDGDGFIHTAPNDTLHLANLNSLYDVKKLVKM